MQSAIAMVSTMIGAMADGGVSATPVQPAKPIAEAAENVTTISVITVPPTDRRNTKTASAMMPNISGIRSCMSAWLARGKAFDRGATPVTATLRPGCAAITSAAMPSA